MVDVESQQASVTNVGNKPVRVTWGSIDYPRSGPLQPGQRVILPIHIANHFAKYHPPVVVGEGEDVRTELRVEVQPYEGETELQPTFVAPKQVFRDPVTGVEHETLEAYTEALTARFLTQATAPAGPPPTPAPAPAEQAPSVTMQAKNEAPRFGVHVPRQRG